MLLQSRQQQIMVLACVTQPDKAAAGGRIAACAVRCSRAASRADFSRLKIRDAGNDPGNWGGYASGRIVGIAYGQILSGE